MSLDMPVLPYSHIYVYTAIRQYKSAPAQIVLQTLLVTPFSRLPAMEWLTAFFGVSFQSSALSHLTTESSGDTASWNPLQSMPSLSFGLFPCLPLPSSAAAALFTTPRSPGFRAYWRYRHFLSRRPCAFPDAGSGGSSFSLFPSFPPPATSNRSMRSFHFSDKSDIHFPLQS